VEESVIPPLPADRDKIEKKLKAIKVSQPIGDLFIASMDQKLIQDITFFDVRRRIAEERDVERYLGIQRPLQPKRVEELRDYVNFIDATFPTSIILAIDSDYAEFDEDTGVLTISNTVQGDDVPSIAFRNLCRVIDGQHRIAGLEGLKQDQQFDVIVSIFIGSDISDQAYVFATVNLEQTKVNKSIAYDLFELARTRSPIKTCHNIAVALDVSEESPFFKRIKRLGVATEGRATETLTQSTFVNSLVGYIADNPKQDRDDLIRGERLNYVTGKNAQRLCFRNLFIDGEDVKIGKIIEQYFLAVRSRWPDAWEYTGKGIMLNRTNGFRALMKFFGKAYNYLASPGDFVPERSFLELFNRVNASWDSFTVTTYRPGTSGEVELRRFLDRSIFG
jgi:DGQHR domain-containing protein